MEKKTENAPHETDGRLSRRSKKAYEKPVVIEYGTVAKLTRGTTGSLGDGGTGGMMRVCL